MRVVYDSLSFSNVLLALLLLLLLHYLMVFYEFRNKPPRKFDGYPCLRGTKIIAVDG